MADPDRIVVQFSCGAASAATLRVCVDRYGPRVHAINAFVADEDDDNRRFLADVEVWTGVAITVLRDAKYNASAMEVWRKRRFIVNRSGAPCSKALKRDVLSAYDQPGDVIAIGYTADEAARWDRYQDANTDKRAIAPLIDAGITKADCFAMITKAGIQLPRMYRLGYHNANCPGCPKGGMGYWNRIRADFPERFEEMAQLQDQLGPGSFFFRDRTTQERISLRMLPPDAGRFEPLESFECGATCELQTTMPW